MNRRNIRSRWIGQAMILALVPLLKYAGFGAAKSPVTAKSPVADVHDLPGGELRMMAANGKPLGLCPLKHTSVTANIAGFVARVHVEQEFHNPSKQPIEAVYTFPLPGDAAVDDMTMLVGNRRIVGKIKRREEARQIYEAAKSSGKTASLLDQERPNIFTQAIANIMPGQKITISISYVNLLKYDDGKYEFVFPMVVGPRYTPGGGYKVPGQRGDPSPAKRIEGDPGATSVVTDAEKITPPIAPQGTRAGHDISLVVRLSAGVPLQGVQSELHPIEVQSNGPSRATIRLRDQQSLPNKDFILRYAVAGSTLQSGVLANARSNGDGYFTLVMQPPVTPSQSEITPKEIIFVIDQTGSQSGWPIRKAKETMSYLVRNMNPGDSFQLLGFNTDLFPCFPAPVHNTPANVAKALKFLDPIEGAGGTDILKAVNYALKLPDDPGRQRIICYLTDGYIGNDMQVMDFIQKNRGRAHMFPFGIGNSVNRLLIDGMAKEGLGTPEYVTLQSSAEAAAARFYRRIGKPLLTDIKVDWGALPVREVFPKQIPDMFLAGRPVLLKGRYTSASSGDVTLRGMLAGQPWSQKIHVTLPATHQAEAEAIPTIWAREKIEALQSQDWMGAQTNNPQANIKEQVIKVALDYRLMSQFTSFVAVQEKVVNKSGAQRTVDVPVEMPEGVSHAGIFGKEAASGRVATRTARAPGRAAPRPRSGYRVAQGQNFAGRSGDPLISVQAPADAQQVIALLPGGDIKRLAFNAASALWEARFDIPTYATEGDYAITIVIVQKEGTRKMLTLHYRVDATPPLGSGAAQIAAWHGPMLHLKMEASADTDRVEALLPWGERVELHRAAESETQFETLLPLSKSKMSGGMVVKFVLTDRAHNRATVVVDMSK